MIAARVLTRKVMLSGIMRMVCIGTRGKTPIKTPKAKPLAR
jgi:hypothetical protein